MSLTPYLDRLKAKKEDVLKGEVGALLHDIGKLDPRFIKSKSLEGGVNFSHEKVEDEGVVSDELITLLKSVQIGIKNEKPSILELIRNHNNRNHSTKLISTLSSCDGIDSGDDKGIVRNKQPITNTVIASVFSTEKATVDLTCMDCCIKNLDKELRESFDLYLNQKIDIGCFRGSVLKSTREAFSSALGETRIPANDVTLFDHSFSTASLYKTQLARAVLENDIKNTEEWRVFGIFWNGARFMSSARKAADALNRQEMINEVKQELKQLFEVEYPVGNTIFEDTDSIFFTFPAFGKSDELAKECMIKAVDIIRTKSNDDLWPVCALSQPRRSPTVIADMMEFFETKKGIEKQSSVLYIQKNEDKFDPENTSYIDNPPLELEIPDGNEKYDICPVCRTRVKKEKHDTCYVCLERRQGRIKGWSENRNDAETIWVNEVADETNRVALISMEFRIKDWLDGKWLQSLWVQTIQDWIYNANILKNPKKPELALLKKEGIIKNNLTEINVENTIKLLEVIANKSGKLDQRKNIFLTFFNEYESPPKSKGLTELIQDIKNRSAINGEVQYKLFNYLFNKQPSPARLRRVWTETHEFIETVQNDIHERLFSPTRKRLILKTESQCLPNDHSLPPTWNAIEVNGLNPDTFQIVQINDTDFTTITNLSEFEYRNRTKNEVLRGLDAVKKAIELSNKLRIINEEDREGKKPVIIQIKNVKPEPYTPTITILKSPYQFQMLAPASSVPEVLEIITSLYDNRFAKVNGKLPLNVSVLVANRKFPLYVLLDSASRMLKDHNGFNKLHDMEPYWDVNGSRSDPYYGFYPTDKEISPEKLTQIKDGKKFYLNPGYFDFDFLGGTADRGRIFYGNEEKPLRGSISFGWIKPRPHNFSRIKDMLRLHDILSELSRTQVNGIEQALVSKLERWEKHEDPDKKKVFHEFAKAVIIDAFILEKWWKMPPDNRAFVENSIDSGLLVDTIQFYNHVLKVKIGGEER